MDRALRVPFIFLILTGFLSLSPAWADEAGDRYAVAAGHYAAGRWKLASAEFSTLIDQYPKFSQRDHALFYHGETLIQLRDFESARDQFRRVLMEHKESRFIARSLFRRGEAGYLSGNLQEAKVDLRQFQQQYAAHELAPFALTFLGEISLTQGDSEDAELWFSKALKQFPKNPLSDDCQLGLARALDAQGKQTLAQKQYELVSQKPGAAAKEALYQLGTLHYRSGKYEQADQALSRLLSLKPTPALSSRASFALGQVRFRQQRFAEAERHLRPLLTSEPPLPTAQQARAQYWLGLVYRAQEKWDPAIALFRKSAERSETGARTAAASFFAGDCLLRRGVEGSAVEASIEFEKGLSQSDKTDWADDCFLGKIRSAAAQGDLPQTVDLCRQFEERFDASPLKSDVKSQQATAHMKQKQYVEATKLLEELVLVGHDHVSQGSGLQAASNAMAKEPKPAPESLAQLAICYAQLGKFDASRQQYAAMTDGEAQPAVVLVTTKHLAEIALASGEQVWARELFAKLASSDAAALKSKTPGDSKASPAQSATQIEGLSGLAWAQLRSNELRESAETFAEILRRNPNDPRAAEAALTRGQILERLGDLNPALTMYREVIERHTKSELLPKAMLHAARLHDRLEQDDDAQRLYEQLIAEHPAFDQADAALHGWAWLLREREDTATANAKFRELRERFPTSPFRAEVTYLLAESAAEAKDYDQAGLLLGEVLSTAKRTVKPPNESKGNHAPIRQKDDSIIPRALYLKGRIALSRNRWDQVSIPLERLIREYPQSDLRLPSEYWIAEAAYRNADFEKAEARLAELSGQVRGREDAWLAMIPLRRAQILAQREQWADALAVAETVESEFPNFKQQYEVDYLIGRCLTGMGRLIDAREAYRKVVRAGDGAKTETAAMAQWMIGETFMHDRKYEEARREYLRTEILYAYPEWQARALLQAGKCHEQQGEWRQAIAMYSDLKKKYSKTASIEEASRRLRVAKQRAASLR